MSPNPYEPPKTEGKPVDNKPRKDGIVANILLACLFFVVTLAVAGIILVALGPAR